MNKHMFVLIFLLLYVPLCYSQVTFDVNHAFFPPVFSTGTEIPKDIEAGDFNKDGLQDLVYLTDKTYCLLMANAPGKYAAPIVDTLISATSDNRLSSIEIGDFNEDAHLDLLLIERSIPWSYHATVFLNNGEATFTESSGIYLGDMADKAYLGYFNKDPYLDFAVSTYNGFANPAKIFSGDGSGNFTSSASLDSIHGYLHVSDINNDLISDFIITNGNAELITYTSTGIYQYQKLKYAASFGLDGAIAGDFDGDKKTDIAAVSENNGFIFWKGNNTGLFTTAVDFPATEAGTQLKKIDLNGDGMEELLSSSNQDLIHCTLFPAVHVTSYLAAYNNLNEYAIKDLNNDTIPDVVTAPSSNLSSIVYGQRNGTFQLPVSHPHIVSLTVADGNQDGKKDILASRTGRGGNQRFLTWYDVSANGFVTPKNNYAIGAGEVNSGDFNGDGKQDIVISTGDSIKVSYAPGNFQLGPFSTVDKFQYPNLSCADFNGDQKDDIVATNDGQLKIYFSEDNGWTPTTPSIPYFNEAKFADFDKDGLMDGLFQLGRTIRVGLGNGSGNFIFKDSINAASAVANFVISDFDRNGIPDLAVSDGFIIRIYYWKDNKLVLQPEGVSDLINGVNINAAADFDNDGFDDLMTITSAANSANCTVNLSKDTAFTPSFNFPTDNYTTGFAEDVNGDDKTDLVHFDISSFVIYLNKTPDILKPLIKSFSPTRVNPGEKVLVRGINFRDATSVLIGTMNTPFTLLDKNTIELTIPSGTKSNYITIDNPHGSDTSPGQLVINSATGIHSEKIFHESIYPNPSSNTISIKGIRKGDIIRIFNTLGIMVNETITQADAITLDVENMEDGIYEVISAEGFRGRFEVQK